MTPGRLSRPGARPDPAACRPAALDDLPACTRVWRAGLADYLGRLNADDGLPVELEPLRRLLAHLLATDPERFWVATRPTNDEPPGPDGGAGGERVVGFASAVVRGETWFLSMLFVDPAEQASGIGRALLERARQGSAGRILGTATDSAQVISNAMYAREGIVPRLPCLQLTGRPGPAAPLPDLPSGVTAVRFDMVAGDGGEDAPGHRALAEAVGAIDLGILGYERPRDHAWLRRDGRQGWLYRDGTGRAVGYGYGAPVGRIGPVAAVAPELLVPIVSHLLGALQPAGASSLWVPGAAGPLVTALLRTGFRLEPFPALLCWSAPLADFERYLPISLALV
jgi:GNAT superfamily N-acetyltransferase